MGHDLVHGRLFPLLLVLLVIVDVEDERHLQVEVKIGVAAHDEQLEEEVDVLHTSDRVTHRVEQVSRRQGLDRADHARVARVVVRAAGLDGVPVHPPFEGRAHHPVLRVVAGLCEHETDLALVELGLDRDVEHVGELLASEEVGVQHRLRGGVERRGPVVAVGHLDDLKPLVADALEPGASAALVNVVLDDHDDPAETKLEEEPHSLGDMPVIVRPDHDSRACDRLVDVEIHVFPLSS